MNRKLHLVSVLLLALAASNRPAFAQSAATTVDLKRGVPSQSYVAVYAQHNPERDYQRAHWQDVAVAVEESQLLERISKVVTARVPDDELDKAKSVVDELKTAVEPINIHDFFKAQQFVYAQKMDAMTSQHLILVEMTSDAADEFAKGITNLMRLVEKHSNGDVPVAIDSDSPAHLAVLDLPGEVPFRPAVGHLNNVFVFSSSEEYARQSLALLTGARSNNDSGASKFDDPRLQAALKKLPVAEDCIAFYDGRQQFEQLRQMITGLAEKAGDKPEAQQGLQLAHKLFDEIAVLDFEATVEYTTDNLNRTVTFGRLIPGTEDRMLTKVLGGGESFATWHRWVPAEATRYSLHTGINLHALYEWAIDFLNTNVPPSHEPLAKFNAWQDKHNLHIDQDILQAFSGESVSISVPAKIPTMLSSEQSVLAMRCQDPEGVRELLHRAVAFLQEIPAMKMQQLQWRDSDELEGFQRLSATVFAAFGFQPVIGFRDGWMIVGSNDAVVQKVLATRAGDHPNILTSESFRRFQLDTDGPVRAVSYTNMARSTRQAATMLKQAGAILPMVIGLAGAEIDPEDLEPVQEIVGLLPSVGEIVEEFDFLDSKLSVTYEGDETGSYFRHSVIYVQPPDEDDRDEEGDEVDDDEDDDDDDEDEDN